MPSFVVIEAPQMPREPVVLGPFPGRDEAFEAALAAVEAEHHDVRDYILRWDRMEPEEALDAWNDWARGNDAPRIVVGRSPARRR